MKLVIAGSYAEFRREFSCSHRDYKYLAVLPDDLRGREHTTLILSGTYYNRKDYLDNESEIHEYCARHFISIKRKNES